MLRHQPEIFERLQKQPLPAGTFKLLERMSGEIQRKNTTTVTGGKLLGVPARVTITNEYRVAVNLFLSCRGIERVKEGEVENTFYRIEKKLLYYRV